jgi:Ca-activated chloride channel family protein
VFTEARSPGQTSDAFRFAAAVASFGMLLRNSEYRGRSSFELVRHLASSALGEDPRGYKRGFLQLVSQAARL